MRFQRGNVCPRILLDFKYFDYPGVLFMGENITKATVIYYTKQKQNVR
jgi:hypothetical protein